MKTFPFIMMLLALVGLQPAIAQQVHTPRPGSSERTKILDAIRPSAASKIRFIVHDLRVVDGRTAQYAYAVVEPSQQEYDGGEFLLRNTGGWRVIWSVTGGGTDDCNTAAAYYQSAIRLLEAEGINSDLLSPQLQEEHLRLGTLAADGPDCSAIGDLGPEPPAIASEPASTADGLADTPPDAGTNRPRILPDSKHGRPITGADLDGDGKQDLVSIVHILPSGAGRTIDRNIAIANPWDTDTSAQPLADEDTQMALLIENSRSGARYLLHSPYVALSNNLQTDGPVEVAPAKSSLARAFRKDCPALRHDFLVMTTEAGIDIALFWNASRFAICWPDDIP